MNEPHVPGSPATTRARLFTFPNIEERTHPVHGHIVQTVVSRTAICPDCDNEGRVELDYADRMVAPCPRCTLGALIDERTRDHIAGDATGPAGEFVGRTFWQRIDAPATVQYEGGRTIAHDPCDACRSHGITIMVAPRTPCPRCRDRAAGTSSREPVADVMCAPADLLDPYEKMPDEFRQRLQGEWPQEIPTTDPEATP